MSYDVRGQATLVTGANRGIGKAIVEALLNHGAAKVYTAVRDVSSVAPLQSQFGEKIVPVELDLTQRETIRAAAESAGDVTLVINNAGVLRTATALSPDASEALDFEMKANVHGLIDMAQAFAPVLKRNDGGAFVQLNSIVSMKCFPQFTTYCASKAAAYAVTQALRTLLEEQGTAVLSVHPGPIATDMGAAAGFEDGADPPEVVAEGIVTALRAGDFHVFPDSMARQVGEAYQSFAEQIVEADLSEG
mgnify:CR=1 FL=1